jgi:hypothetical protein
MTKPTTTVEIAFDAGWTGTPTWTDVTTYTRHADGISLSHWRGDEDSEAGPSSLSLGLNNSDGRFTPGNAAGAHYPNVKKGRRIRVRSTVNGNTYERGTGYVNDWSVDWPGKVSTFATCQVTASSRMARLGQTAELRSIIEEEILADSPMAYYTMGEPEGATSASDASGNAQPKIEQRGSGTDVTFGTATGPGTDDLTAASFAGGRYLAFAPSVPLLDTFPTLEFFFSTSSTATDSVLFKMISSNGVTTITGTVTAAGKFKVIHYDGISDVWTVTSATTITDGSTHHLALRFWDNGGNPCADLMVDGVVEVHDFTTTVFGVLPWSLTLGGATGLPTTTGTIAHAALFVETTEIPSTHIAAHADAGLDGGAGETPAARLTRYASFVSLTTSDLDFDTGQVQGLAHIDTTGKTALACMREVEETEDGVLFDGLNGKLKFHDRAHRYGATSAFTLDYAAGHIANDLRPVLDDQLMCNGLTVTNTNGVSARVVDEVSISGDGSGDGDYGLYRDTLDVATTDTEEPGNRASWVVERYEEPLTRISSIDVQLESSAIGTALTESILAAEVGTMFTVTNLPSNAPSSSMRLFVEGMSETITADSHRITFRTSPAELFDVWILDSTTYSVLDSTTRLAL